MPLQRIKRPPPVWRHEADLQPQFTQLFAPMGVGHGGPRPSTPSALGGGGFGYQTQYVITVNPVKEAPKLINVSAAQPISVAGWRRRVRTYMGVPLLQRGGGMDRVHHAPQPMGRNSERDKIRGTYARGWTYQIPQPNLGPGSRVITPNSGSGLGGAWVVKANR